MKWIPKILSLLCLWGAVISILLFVEPELLKDIIIEGMYLPFYTILGVAIWYTLAIVTKMVWKSLIMTVVMISGLYATMFGLMHLGLAIILLLTLGIESWYMYKSK